MAALILQTDDLQAEDFHVDDPVPLRDPTRPLNAQSVSEKKAGGLRLNSVLISSQRKIAVINGKTVALNGWVDGVRVTHISAGQVTVVHRGESKKLYLRVPVRRSGHSGRSKDSKDNNKG